MATCKCQDATNRLEIKIRTVEGQHGVLNAYIIPKQAPKTCQKVCQSAPPLPHSSPLYCLSNRPVPVFLFYIIHHSQSTFQIKPLSLHERVTPQTIESSLSRPLNTLTLTGPFTLSDVHMWVSSCLPDVPPKYVFVR